MSELKIEPNPESTPLSKQEEEDVKEIFETYITILKEGGIPHEDDEVILQRFFANMKSRISELEAEIERLKEVPEYKEEDFRHHRKY